MSSGDLNSNRRSLLKTGLTALGGLTLGVPVAQALLCGSTPEQTEGPFYPVQHQADKDTDLTFVQGKAEQAQGRIIQVEGVVTDSDCNPVVGALVEIWQACASGKYNHPGDPNPAPLDPNFQYWGKALSDHKGFYRFKTIVPGAYQANASWKRPPHIHFKIQKLGFHELITQLYFAGEALNDKDLILRQLPAEERKKVVVPLNAGAGPVPVAEFNISIRQVR